MSRFPKRPRKIVVDGETYFWNFRTRYKEIDGETKCYDVFTAYLENFKASGLRIQFYTAPNLLMSNALRYGENNFHLPSIAASVIRYARANGWKPTENSNKFELNNPNDILTLIGQNLNENS